MKQKGLLCLGMVLCLILAACSGGKIKNAELSYGQSEIYTDKEIQDAMDVVLKFFSKEFEGCTLTKLWYDEEISEKRSADWAEQYGVEEVIVLLSDFDVDSSGGDGSLNPNTAYTGWGWVLARSGGSWELKDWGYA